jgi:hypothetical protein
VVVLRVVTKPKESNEQENNERVLRERERRKRNGVGLVNEEKERGKERKMQIRTGAGRR